MNERILKLLSLCLQAKEKGFDVFFNYSPHVNAVSVQFHVPFWKSPEKDKDGEYISGTDNCIMNVQFYIDAERFDESEETKLTDAETYLKELIA